MFTPFPSHRTVLGKRFTNPHHIIADKTVGIGI